jgi:putative transposase
MRLFGWRIFIFLRISMDGCGKAFDNIFIERLWRTLKYEDVYLKHYETINEAKENISAYFHFYNTERLHQSLNYKMWEFSPNLC